MTEPRLRFETKVLMCPMSGCWLWTGSDNGQGYGTFRLNKRMEQAHRASWVLFCGPIPSDKLVLHRCDVRACVNPAHLFLGTQLENVADMFAKGRAYDRMACGIRPPVGQGERNNGAKLTETAVREIRGLIASGLLLGRIAERFNVTRPSIANIRDGKTWTHI